MSHFIVRWMTHSGWYFIFLIYFLTSVVCVCVCVCVEQTSDRMLFLLILNELRSPEKRFPIHTAMLEWLINSSSFSLENICSFKSPGRIGWHNKNIIDVCVCVFGYLSITFLFLVTGISVLHEFVCNDWIEDAGLKNMKTRRKWINPSHAHSKNESPSLFCLLNHLWQSIVIRTFISPFILNEWLHPKQRFKL